MQRWLVLLLSLSVLLLLAFAGGDDLQAIVSKLEKYRKAFPQEKVHLHFDKPYYSIGDTLYFKAYVVNAEKNLPSAISNVLYVDLIDENGAVRQTLRRPITDGVCWGTVDLVDSLQEGAYRIRAYTNWMRNFNDAYFFNQVVVIGNGLANDITATATFRFAPAASKKMYSVSIAYQALRGNNMAGKEATYSIFINGKEVEKGKGTIADDGTLHIGFSKIRQANKQPAEIVTRIRLDGKKTATRVMKFVLPVSNYTIQFFPEGGQLVTGLPARVGFKAVDAAGVGAAVSGDVRDQSSSNVVSFKSGVAGIGSFSFTPQAGRLYQAVVRYKDGTEETVALPKAEEQGYVLLIDNTAPENVTVTIAARQATPVDAVTLIAQSNNRPQFASAINLVGDSASVVLSKKKFPTGIMQFTLFDAAGQPVAERLIFINHNDQLRIGMLLNKPSYTKREPVTMTLTVKDAAGNPVSGNFSIAVTDGTAAPRDSTKDRGLLSNLLLTSDLRGYIENPEYYFTDVNGARQRALDDLLLTQGWRRFVWRDVLAEKHPTTPYMVEKDLAVSGRVLSMKGEPVAGATVTLLSKKGTGYMLDTLTDDAGRFLFDDLDFSDDKPFVLQAAKGDGSKAVQVKLDEFLPPAGVRINESDAWPEAAPAVQPYLAYSARRFDEMKKLGLLKDSAHVLKEVIVTAQKLSKQREAVAPSANLNGPGNADQILTYEDLRNCSDLQCLTGKLTGVTFKFVIDQSGDTRNKVYRLQAFSTRGMGKPMLIIVDGMDISNRGADIRNIPAANVQSIEVLRSGAYSSTYGTRASGGVLVITTKRGGIDYNAGLISKPATNALFTTTKGYAVYRTFYAPDYSRPSQGLMPDWRSTIYWQPDITTDDDGKATIKFYNADNAARYNIVIEGFSANGKLGRAVYSYEVK